MKEWFPPVVPLVTAALAAFVTYFLTARAKRHESILRFKEEKYAKLLVKLQGFVGATASAQLKREFFEEQYQAWLYASDDVVSALNVMVVWLLKVEARRQVPRADGKLSGKSFLP